MPSIHPAHHLFDEMFLRSFRRIASPSFRTYSEPISRFFSPVSSTNQLNTQVFAYETSSRLLDSKKPKNRCSVASFLKDLGFSDILLGKIEKSVPKVLSLKLEQTIKTKINTFKNLGLSTTQIDHVVSASPRILYRISNHNIERASLALKKVLGDKFYDSRILKNFGMLLNYDLDKTLVPNAEYLKSCGIQQSQMMLLFYNYPRFLLHKAENLKEFVRRVDEIGVARESKLYIYAVRTIGSMSLESWEHKLDVFRGLGYTEVDIISAFRKYPNVFALSEKKIKETAEFLLNSGRCDRSFIFRHPYVFILSLDRRLKPRLRVLEILERHKDLKFKPNTTVFCISDSKFFDKFVRPHLDEIKELEFMVNDAKL